MSDKYEQGALIYPIQGYDIIIDAEDLDKVSGCDWKVDKQALQKIGSVYFIFCYKKDRKTHADLFHRKIMGFVSGDGRIVDHINGDTLDNRKCNLRECTRTENNQNARKRKDNTSGYKGVQLHKKTKKWVARISNMGKRISLGYFDDLTDAHAAYCEASKKYHKAFGRTE